MADLYFCNTVKGGGTGTLYDPYSFNQTGKKVIAGDVVQVVSSKALPYKITKHLQVKDSEVPH